MGSRQSGHGAERERRMIGGVGRTNQARGLLPFQPREQPRSPLDDENGLWLSHAAGGEGRGRSMMASRPHFRTIQILPKDLLGTLHENMTRMDNAAHLLTAWTAHVPGG